MNGLMQIVIMTGNVLVLITQSIECIYMPRYSSTLWITQTEVNFTASICAREEHNAHRDQGEHNAHSEKGEHNAHND